VADWPGTLPAAPQLRGFEEQPANTLIRTEMDVGPAKVRRRITAGVRPHKMLFHMDAAQLEIFDQFYTDVLGDGALPFNFTHPRTGETKSFRIVSPPTYTTEEPDEVWFVSIEMEQMPA
jgi:hypothetical protein